MDREKKHDTIKKEALKQVFSSMMQNGANQNRGGSLASIVHDWQTKRRIDYIFDNADAGSQKPEQAAAAHEAGSGVFVPDSLLKYRSQIDTPRARKYFPKAIEAGIIKRTKSGYLKLVSSKALLAYFLNKVYSVGTFPDTALNLLFNESRLKQSIYRTNEGNKNGKPKGYELIDELFDEE